MVAGCKIEVQGQGGVRANCMSSLINCGREARLARGGNQEHEAFLGHEMRGPARTRRGDVSMAEGR